MSSVGGTVEESVMLKALDKWVNLGVVKEKEGGVFVLLEVQEEGGVKPTASRQGKFLPHRLCGITLLITEQLRSRKHLR